MNTNKEWNPALTTQCFDNAPFSVFSQNSKVSGWIILYNNLSLTRSGRRQQGLKYTTKCAEA